MNILRICINNYYRLIAKKSIIAVLFIVIPLIMTASILISNKSDSVEHIAVISQNTNFNIENDKLDIVILNKEPELYELILGNYDAVAVDRGNGTFDIKTIQSKELKDNLNDYFNNKNIQIDFNKDKPKRGTGTNILGYLSLIILIQCVIIMTFYPEDRDCGAFRRILTSTVKSKNYLFAQCLFNFLVLFIPTFVTVLIIHGIFHVNIGFSLLSFSSLLALLCAFGIALALTLTSLIRTLTVCISISSGLDLFLGLLSGAIIPFTNTSEIFEKLTNVIPLKTFLTVSQGIENGSSIFMYSGNLIYILLWTAVLYTLGNIITQKKVSAGLY